MKWVYLSPLIPPNSRKVIQCENLSVLLIHDHEQFYAIDNHCSHEYLPLDNGDIEDQIITCPFHGAQFCIKTGNVLSAPAFDNIKSYALRQNGDQIEIGLEE